MKGTFEWQLPFWCNHLLQYVLYPRCKMAIVQTPTSPCTRTNHQLLLKTRTNISARLFPCWLLTLLTLLIFFSLPPLFFWCSKSSRSVSMATTFTRPSSRHSTEDAIGSSRWVLIHRRCMRLQLVVCLWCSLMYL